MFYWENRPFLIVCSSGDGGCGCNDDCGKWNVVVVVWKIIIKGCGSGSGVVVVMMVIVVGKLCW